MREFDLLRRIYGANAALPPSVTLPPGDDMGGVRVAGADVLATVDQLVDGIHFKLAQTPIEKIGRKAITRNLSDVAAMAAKPVGAVAAACLPRDFGEERAAALFEAMRRTAAGYGCPLFGGDVSIWDHPLILSVTVLAEAAGVEPVLRRGARVGDVVCVTGELGGSEEAVDGQMHHLDFEPRLEVARALASHPRLRPSAMIDLSDGLARDLGHICAQSGVSAQLRHDALPISRAAHARARRLGGEAWRHALGDGEDYELCFTLGRDAVETALPAEVEGVRITPVGVVGPAAGRELVTLVMPDGAIVCVDGVGWEHQGT